MALPNPATKYSFNTMQEIKSHSSILFNERLAILFYLMDMNTIDMQTTYDVGTMLRVRSIMKQIYVYVRTLIRNNPTMRSTLNLDTKEDGIYIPDVAFGIIDNMIEWCEENQYTLRRLHIIIQNIYQAQHMLIDILQYYHYFIRPDFRQKPDIEVATERYKEIADQRTIGQLYDIVGKKNTIDFEGLGTTRISLQQDKDDEEEQKLIDLEKDDSEESDNDGLQNPLDGLAPL